MVDAYETVNGMTVLNLANPYLDDKHLQPSYNTANTMYDPQDPYANRDPRFYASVYYNGSKSKAFWNFAESKESYENYPASICTKTTVIATYIEQTKNRLHKT